MTRFLSAAPIAALALLALFAGRSEAQYVVVPARPVVTYYYAPPPPVVYQQPPPVYQQPPPAVYQQPPPPAPLVQREVVYPHGKHVLYGDGVTRPWQWVWVPAQ